MKNRVAADPTAAQSNPKDWLRRGRTSLEILGYELRLALRTLRRRPTFAIAVVATLGLGIAANTLVFSIAYGVLLKPLPYPDPDRLVGVFRLIPSLMGENPRNASISTWYAVPYALFLNWAEGDTVFESCGAYAGMGATIQEKGEPVRILGARATSGVFSSLGVGALVGRPFVPEDDRVGQPMRAVLSYGFWQRHFGGDPTVIGQPLVANGRNYDIVGVMPREFNFPSAGTQLWVTFEDERKTLAYRKGGYLQVIARLKPGIVLTRAQAEMEEVHRRIVEVYPDDREFGIRLIPRMEMVGAQIRPILLLLVAAVGTVLLIACTNLANLTLVRITERRKELGVRQALGEGRGRLLLRQWSESLLLSLGSGAIGLVLAALSLEAVLAFFPTPIPRADEVSLDKTVILFTLGLSLAVGLLIGLLPSLRRSRTSMVDSLLDVGRTITGGKRRNRMHALLVAVQVALAFVLLTSTGLFLRSLSNLIEVDPGIGKENILISRVSMPEADASSGGKIVTSYREIMDKVRGLAGVRDVAGATQMPFAGGLSFPPTTVERSDGEVQAAIHTASITPSFFEVLNVPLVAGRFLTDDDRSGTAPVAVINQAMARQYWPDQNPLGRRIKTQDPEGPQWLTVVGVVRDFRYSLEGSPFPAIYRPFAQSPEAELTVIAKTGAPAASLAEAVRHILRDIDRSRPVRVSILEEIISRSDALTYNRFVIILLGGLAAAAALLALLGIYGVLAYAVSQRTREIGIRLALGAGAGQVIRSFLCRGILMTAAGLAMGIIVSMGIAGLLGSMLFGIQPTDPATLAAVALAMTASAALAAFLPAWRAARVEPATVLHSE